jgi:hypothetical protein
LRDAETEHETLVVNPWSSPKKILTGHPCYQTADLAGNPWTTASPATTRSLSPHRGPHVTTPAQDGLGLDDHQTFAPVRPPARQQDPKQAIKAAQARRRVRLRCSTAIWWRSAIDSNSSEIRVRGSLRVTETALLVGFAMKADYRHAFESTVEFVRIKF